MHEPDFWTQCAEAMELSIEGRRLIAEEVAGLARSWWHEASQKLVALVQRPLGRTQLPPA
jgi:hypothetical protein